jgi:hypothetical protein
MASFKKKLSLNIPYIEEKATTIKSANKKFSDEFSFKTDLELDTAEIKSKRKASAFSKSSNQILEILHSSQLKQYKKTKTFDIEISDHSSYNNLKFSSDYSSYMILDKCSDDCSLLTTSVWDKRRKSFQEDFSDKVIDLKAYYESTFESMKKIKKLRNLQLPYKFKSKNCHFNIKESK